jgi:CDP-diacylglycerol--glycerol-3-phosphate 3-phosphatidyltransferase
LFALFNLSLIFGAAAIGMQIYLRSKPDLSNVRGSRLLGSSVRGWYFTNLDPFEHLFVRWGVTPAAITLAQLAGSLLCAVAYGCGLIYTGGFLMLASGTLDILDGRLARRLGSASKGGAFLDSVVDRYCEFAVLAGLIVFFETGWPVWALLFTVLGGMMVSYTRARAEGLGQDCQVGLLQRPERFVIMGFGSIFSSVLTHAVGGEHVLLELVILFLAVFTNLTALQRFLYVRRALARAEEFPDA